MVRQPRPPSSNSAKRPPLHERNHSQNNTLRIVPPTPPRFLDATGPSTTTSPTSTTTATSPQSESSPEIVHSPTPTKKRSQAVTPGNEKKHDHYRPQGHLSDVSRSQGKSRSWASAASDGSNETSHSRYLATADVPTSPRPKRKLQVDPNNPHLFKLVPTTSSPTQATSSSSVRDDAKTNPKSRNPPSFVSSSPVSSIRHSRTIDPFSPTLPSGATSVASLASPSSASQLPENTTANTSSSSSTASSPHDRPWNFPLGEIGLRKVPKTPESEKAALQISPPPLPRQEISDDTHSLDHQLASKPSFATTESEHSNYKVYRLTPPRPFPPSSVDHSSEDNESSSKSNNWEVFGDSSPPASVIHHQVVTTSSAEEDESESSVIYHPQNHSPSTQSIEDDEFSTSYVTIDSAPAGYSQESLIVAPLQPVRNKRSHEQLGYYKSRSRESLRALNTGRSGSISSIGTILTHREALKAIIGSGSVIDLPGVRKNSWAAEPSAKGHMIAETPHVWSSQLSTIGSVSDGSTGDRASQSWSGRRSNHSRQMLSIGSSLEVMSRTDSLPLEPPRPAFARDSNGRRGSNNSSSIRLVEDSMDEDGDGLGDLHELRNRPSRTRLSGFYSMSLSSDSRTNTMRSTSSSRSRSNSLLASSIPQWAKIYYGSGERKFLMGPGGGSISSEDSSRNSSFRSGSPADYLPHALYSPRKRPREGNDEINHVPHERPSSLDIRPSSPAYVRPFRTSSVWSPHLRRDLAARTRLALWEAPSTTGSIRSSTQIFFFVTGFIIPFSWFIGALWKLPPNPMQEMQERDSSTSNLDASHNFDLQFGPSDEKRYESARWWRRLNRFMSILGVIIIALIVILVVIGLRENWG